MLERESYALPAISLRRADTKKFLGNFPNYEPLGRTGVRTILGSASPFLMLPTAMAETVSEEIARVAKNLELIDGFPEGFFRTERFNSIKIVRFGNLAQIRQFPSLEITFKGSDGTIKALEIDPQHYFKEMDKKDPLVRMFALRETKGDVVLGQPFLENHYTVFDRLNQRIGFGNIDIACAE